MSSSTAPSSACTSCTGVSRRDFPDILFESCASGGGRFDPGMLAYRAAGLDERRHRRGRAAPDPVGDLDGVPAGRDGRARLGRAEPSDRPGHADRDPRRGRVLRRVRVRAGPDGPDRPRARGRRRPGRVLRPAPRPVPARPSASAREPVRARPGRGVLDGGRPGGGDRGRGRLPDPEPADAREPPRPAPWPRARRRSTGCRAGRTRTTCWSGANAGERTGAELMAAGFALDLERHDAARLGDFWARLFVLERRLGPTGRRALPSPSSTPASGR